jgi:nucleolar protein 15
VENNAKLILIVLTFSPAAPAAADVPAKKTKKADAKPAPTKDAAAPKPVLKRKENGTAPKTDGSVKANGASARDIKPRKRAADFLSDEEDDEPAAPAPEKQAAKKKSKKEDTTKRAKKAEKVVEESEESDEEAVEDIISEPESGEDELDDQTAELIKGFESSGDEDASDDEGFNPDQPVPRIPDSKKAKRKILKKQKKGEAPEEPGTVYIG